MLQTPIRAARRLAPGSFPTGHIRHPARHRAVVHARATTRTVSAPILNLNTTRGFAASTSRMAIAAVGQICSTASMAHNLAQCVRLMEEAAGKGAEVIFFPEASDYIASSPEESLSLAQPESSSPFVQGLQAAARQHNLHVHVGIHVPAPAPAAATDKKLLNRTVWILPTGALDPSRRYDKLHLFDYGALRESRHTQAGAALTPPFGTPVGRVGSLVCFDLRFPEAALALAQPQPASSSSPSPWAAEGGPAQVLTYPSAFTVPTGEAHWEVLLRARAVEAQCWVVAAAQVGWHGAGGPGPAPGRVSYGRSMVVDPWGRVRVVLPGVREVPVGSGREEGNTASVGEKGTGTGTGTGVRMVMEEGAVGALGLVDIDLGEWERVRERMPLIRRTDVYPGI